MVTTSDQCASSSQQSVDHCARVRRMDPIERTATSRCESANLFPATQTPDPYRQVPYRPSPDRIQSGRAGHSVLQAVLDSRDSGRAFPKSRTNLSDSFGIHWLGRTTRLLSVVLREPRHIG